MLSAVRRKLAVFLKGVIQKIIQLKLFHIRSPYVINETFDGFDDSRNKEECQYLRTKAVWFIMITQPMVARLFHHWLYKWAVEQPAVHSDGGM